MFNDALAIEVSRTISYGVNDELENIDLPGRTVENHAESQSRFPIKTRQSPITLMSIFAVYEPAFQTH
jgi:hypothetical protein